MAYTVGIKRFLRSPFYKKYKVVDHSAQGEKLLLTCETGDQMSIPMLDKRIVRVYPDYQTHTAMLKKGPPVGV